MELPVGGPTAAGGGAERAWADCTSRSRRSGNPSSTWRADIGRDPPVAPTGVSEDREARLRSRPSCSSTAAAAAAAATTRLPRSFGPSRPRTLECSPRTLGPAVGRLMCTGPSSGWLVDPSSSPSSSSTVTVGRSPRLRPWPAVGLPSPRAASSSGDEGSGLGRDAPDDDDIVGASTGGEPTLPLERDPSDPCDEERGTAERARGPAPPTALFPTALPPVPPTAGTASTTPTSTAPAFRTWSASLTSLRARGSSVPGRFGAAATAPEARTALVRVRGDRPAAPRNEGDSRGPLPPSSRDVPSSPSAPNVSSPPSFSSSL